MTNKEIIRQANLPHHLNVRVAYECANLVIHLMDDSSQYAMRLVGAWLGNYNIPPYGDIYNAARSALIGDAGVAASHGNGLPEEALEGAPDWARAAANAAMAVVFEHQAVDRAIQTVELVEVALGAAALDHTFAQAKRTSLPMNEARKACTEASRKMREIIEKTIAEC